MIYMSVLYGQNRVVVKCEKNPFLQKFYIVAIKYKKDIW